MEVGASFAEPLYGVRAVARHHDVIPLRGQQGFGEASYLRFVVDDEHKTFDVCDLGWRRANKHGGIVIRHEFCPFFREEHARDLACEFINATDHEVFEGDTIDSAGRTCEDFQSHPCLRSGSGIQTGGGRPRIGRLRKDVKEKCKQADSSTSR
jgi:hypothetical protein